MSKTAFISKSINAMRLAIPVCGRARPVSWVLLFFSGVILRSLLFRTMRYDGDLNNLTFCIVALWLFGSFAAHRQMESLAMLAKAIAVFLLTDVAAFLSSAALAIGAAGLHDATLQQLDRIVFGFSIWPGVTTLYAHHERIMTALCYAYSSIEWQPFLVMAALCAFGEFDRLWRFLTAWSFGLLVCVCVFPLCPATGAYSYFHISRLAVPEIIVDSAWHYPTTLAKLQSGEFHTLNYDVLEGIIAMPSFHACSSVILGLVFLRERLLAVPFGILNSVMWISSIPVGGHYGVDVLAGTLVALFAIGLSDVAHRRAVARPTATETWRSRPGAWWRGPGSGDTGPRAFPNAVADGRLRGR